MKVDLHNFFQYYDPKNPKHVAAVEQFEVDIDFCTVIGVLFVFAGEPVRYIDGFHPVPTI